MQHGRSCRGLKGGCGTGSAASVAEASVSCWRLAGTVCDDNFNTVAATVACRQMGFTSGTVVLNTDIADGTGSIWLDAMSWCVWVACWAQGRRWGAMGLRSAPVLREHYAYTLRVSKAVSYDERRIES